MDVPPVADPSPSDVVAYDEPPVPIHRPDPVYPEWPKEAGITGRVVPHVLVGTDGRVRRILVIRDVKGLTEAARDALGRWTFRPARWNGKPVAVWVAIPVEFRL